MADKCQECYFYKDAGRRTRVQVGERLTHNVPYGTCRVRPPLASGGWPVVNADDWCGEFSTKKPEEGGLIRAAWAIRGVLDSIADELRNSRVG